MKELSFDPFALVQSNFPQERWYALNHAHKVLSPRSYLQFLSLAKYLSPGWSRAMRADLAEKLARLHADGVKIPQCTCRRKNPTPAEGGSNDQVLNAIKAAQGIISAASQAATAVGKGILEIGTAVMCVDPKNADKLVCQQLRAQYNMTQAQTIRKGREELFLKLISPPLNYTAAQANAAINAIQAGTVPTTTTTTTTTTTPPMMTQSSGYKNLLPIVGLGLLAIAVSSR